MTFLAKDIRDHLRDSPDCYDRFGEHIYEGRLPQGANYEAALVINIVSQQPEYYLGGEVGLHMSQVQIDVWYTGERGAVGVNELAETVRNRLSGYRGDMGDGFCNHARIIRYDSTAPEPVDASNLHRRRVSMDFEITHTADVPSFS
jgi:hypothetical protein